MDTKKLFELVCNFAHRRCPEVFPEYNEAVGRTFSSVSSGSSFPGFWLEIPLNESQDESKIDLHVQFSKKEIADIKNFQGDYYGYRPLFEWFSEFGYERNGIALAFDMADDRNSMTCAGSALNTNSRLNVNDAEKFFEVSGYPEAVSLLHETLNRIPEDWHTWYLAAISGRRKRMCRADCYICNIESDLFSRQLRNIGYSFDTERIEKFVSWFSELNSKCNLEIQLDRNDDGTMSESLGISIGFAMINTADFRNLFAGEKGSAIISKLSEMSVSGERIKHLRNSSFSSILKTHSGFAGVVCIPAFIKTVWVRGIPVKSKLYCMFSVKHFG